MSFLSNALPGFRELRAPLAAGYIWLLAIYVAIEPHVPDAKHAHGLYATLLHLRDAASSVGLAVAVSFAAYLVGAISEGVLGRFWQEDRLASVGSPIWAAPYTSKGKDALEAEVLAHGRRLGEVQPPSAPYGWATPFVTNIASDSPELNSLIEEYRVSSDPFPGIAGDLVYVYVPFAYRRDSPWRQDHLVKPNEAWAAVSKFLSDRVVRDFRLMRIRLMGKETELFAVADRLQAEAEFRFAIVPPLAALAIAVASRVEWYVGLVVLILTAGTLWTLARQGILRLRQSGDTLLDALRVGRVASPTLELLDAAVPDDGRSRRDPSGSSKADLMS
jgi:hypothetical protein